MTLQRGDQLLNSYLKALEEIVDNTFKKELQNGVPPKSLLIKALDDFRFQKLKKDDENGLYDLIERFISGEIKFKEKEKTPATIKTYRTTVGHLKAYELVKKVRLTFDTINLDFLYKYLTFIRQEFTSSQLSHENEDFFASREEVDSVYLNQNEVVSLWRTDFSNNKKLEYARDLFVFGCSVGLRYSDYSTVQPENIVKIEGQTFIKKYTAKAKTLVIIPAHHLVLEIFEKYKHQPNRLPPATSNQHFNETIKLVCREAGFTQIGRLDTSPTLQLWERISSHTARRSFATNVYLSGFPVPDLKKITGHANDQSFYKYIKHSKLDSAQRLEQHWKKLLAQIDE